MANIALRSGGARSAFNSAGVSGWGLGLQVVRQGASQHSFLVANDTVQSVGGSPSWLPTTSHSQPLAESLNAPLLQVRTDTMDFDSGLIFEQEPNQIIDALLPLYLNSTLLRALQEALACELAARMNAMNAASDNAKDLKRKLNVKYNRQRQAAITNQIIEIVSGASA